MIQIDHDTTLTGLLEELRDGDRRALDGILPLLYGELRQVAEQQRRRWQGDDTMNATALVHEAYLRMAAVSSPDWEGRPHVLAVAARAMRQVLVDYARGRHRAKRGGGMRRVPLDEIEHVLRVGGDGDEAAAEAIVALDVALERLERHDPRQSRIVECRFFGGLSIPDTAAALGISPATVKRGWAMAQAWLHRELSHARELDR